MKSVRAMPASKSTPKDSVRAARPRTPRATPRHSKAEPNAEVKAPEVKAPAAAPRKATPESIAQLAYSYWESRGYQGGDPIQDWVRAEQELSLV